LSIHPDRSRPPCLERYRDYKRSSAQLNFDDLIFAARDLLRDHDTVRGALGERFRHVLVDEFQDTDPLQTEIFWRLCGDAPAPDAHWSQFRIRPGALFLVGDPKQAIYRFRGADVGAYLDARTAFQAHDKQSLRRSPRTFARAVPFSISATIGSMRRWPQPVSRVSRRSMLFVCVRLPEPHQSGK